MTPHELTAQLAVLRDLICSEIKSVRNVMDERHALYAERDSSRRMAVDAAFAAQKSGIDTALTAADRAVTKAEMATEKRFDGVNEFRSVLDNQQRTLISRIEVDVIVRAMEEKVQNVQKQLDAQSAERRGVVGGWGYAVGAVGLLLAFSSVILIGFKFISGVR